MNEQIIKIGLESGMLNYVDNETPRHYFLSGYADEQDLGKFAKLIVQECANIDFRREVGLTADDDYEIGKVIKLHFGVLNENCH